MTKDEAAEMIKDDMRLHHDYLSGTYRKALNMAVEALKSEQVRHGHWFNVTNSESVDYEFACSICGYSNFEDVVNVFNYCPCCGAKMDEVEDETD